MLLLSIAFLLPVLLFCIAVLANTFTGTFRWLYQLLYPLFRSGFGRMSILYFLPFLSGVSLALGRP